jgi:phosphohistidine phosphatase
LAKRLTIIRHAKSSWDNPDFGDHDRPLNKRGLRNAPEMGARLAKRNWLPDLFLASTAKRARDTAALIAGKVGYAEERIVFDDPLYLAESEEWQEIIESISGEADHVACFGHNPGITELANHFSGDPIENVPTCGLIDMGFEVDAWANVFAAKPVSFEFDYPKNPQP